MTRDDDSASETELETQFREKIKNSGLSLSELCRRSGVDKGMLSRFLRQERTLTLATVGKVCAVLGLRLTEGDSEEQLKQKPAGRRRGGASSRPTVSSSAGKTKPKTRIRREA